MNFPYDGLPAERSWSRAVRDVPRETFDPQGGAKFHLPRTTRIASAGSCFAVRVAEALRAYGFDYIDAEPGGALLPAELATRFGYRPLSARYGNVYTSLQLLQLLERAFGAFVPEETAWETSGGFVDPFRPRIQPYPFVSIAELETDRRSHLAAVRHMFETLELFVFTLGLTEVWVSKRDGAAFPACPGRGFGSFDADRYEMRHLDVATTVETLERFAARLHSVNPSAKLVLTVSPVPIAATMRPMHVARASMLTKSILVVAAETVAQSDPLVDYFASYETVMYGGGPEAFEQDRRTVREPYVERVLAGLLRHYFELDIATLERRDAVDPDVYIKPCDEDELVRLIELDERRRSAL